MGETGNLAAVEYLNMRTRCKFKLDKVERSMTITAKLGPDGKEEKDQNGRNVYVPAEMHTLVMSPVYANNDPAHENSQFWRYTPSGQFTLGTVNKAAVEHMVLGAEYYIDITPA